MDINHVNPIAVATEFTELVRHRFPSFEPSVAGGGEKLISKKLLARMLDLMTDYVFQEESQLEGPSQQSQTSWSQSQVLDDDGVPVKKEKSDVPLKRKIEILKLIKAHPKWTLNTIQKNGAKEFKHQNYKKRWERDVANGGTKYEKYVFIAEYVYSKFKEARDESNCLRDINLRQWALQAVQTFRDQKFQFKASSRWVTRFKQRRRISSRKVTKLVTRREIRSQSSILESAKIFQDGIKSISPSFPDNLIINTDQVGFTYEITANRTLSHKGEKLTLGSSKSPTNLATHSYTVQYNISKAGKIIGDVFLCLQEKGGKMGPTVEKGCFAAENVTVTCSSSGKLTSSLFEYYLDEVILKAVKEDFLFILDSWGGQTNSILYNERFGFHGNPHCTLKIIPKKCTPICQPLDTTFNRQLKYLARAIYLEAALNYSINLHPMDEITTRNNIIKLHSLIHNQLSAEVFCDMIRYAWFSAGLTDEKPIFQSVKEVCFTFPDDKNPHCSKCTNSRFIICAQCQEVLCFQCFFYEYHFHFN